MYDLERFLEAQDNDYKTALRELQHGRKTTHWIWYIFPQLAELGFSDRSKFYGIEDIYEARAYLDHPILGPRYLACVETLLVHRGSRVEILMGGSVDAKKLQSSLTLMEAAGGGEQVRQSFDLFFNGERCRSTRKILGIA